MLLDKFIYPTFGDEGIDKISNDDVNAWYDALEPGRESIKAQSYSLLRTIFASAASERPTPMIPYNPAHIRGAGNTKRAHHVQQASLEELRIIVEELPDRYKLMALLAAWCAMRFGELAELRRSDIDLRTNRVKIRRGVVRVDGEFIVGPPKSDAGGRDVAIPPHLVPLVKDHLKNLTAPGRDALLFPAAADDNLHMAPSTLYKVYYPARKAAGAKTCDGTTCATRARCSLRTPARDLPSSWVDSVTRRRVPRCATSTPRRIVTRRSPGGCRSCTTGWTPMSPDRRDRRKATKPKPKSLAVRTGPSPDDEHEVVFFKRHKADDANEATPGRESLDSYPASVRAKMRAALIAVATAPPKRFAGGGYWEAMKGYMSGWFELRADGPRRHHYRLFCLLDYEAKAREKPLLVIIDGRDKPFRTVLSEKEYADVRALGEEYLSRNPRSIA
jgi:integrase